MVVAKIGYAVVYLNEEEFKAVENTIGILKKLETDVFSEDLSLINRKTNTFLYEDDNTEALAYLIHLIGGLEE